MQCSSVFTDTRTVAKNHSFCQETRGKFLCSSFISNFLGIFYKHKQKRGQRYSLAQYLFSSPDYIYRYSAERGSCRYGGWYECKRIIFEACHCTSRWTGRYGGWDVYKRLTTKACHCTGTWTSRCSGWYECKCVISGMYINVLLLKHVTVQVPGRVVTVAGG